MRVFVTGASGYIGNAVAKAFRLAGHHVLGLVRSDHAAENLRQSEIEPIISDIAKPEVYAEAARDSNVLVHCAFENTKEGVVKDAKALEALIGYARENTLPKSLIYTSGAWVYGSTKNKIADESTPLNPIDLVKWRPQHEEMALKSASYWLKPVVIRPGIVYGGQGGLTALWFEGSKKGIIPFYGTGGNHFSMIHIEDLARLYVAAAENELGQAVLNAVDGHCPSAKECAEAIGSYLKLPTAAEEFQSPLLEGFLADQKVSADRAYRLLGWRSKLPSFIDGVKEYFHAWKSSQK